MNKSFVEKVLAVLLGISLLIVLFSWVSLVMDASLADDAIKYAGLESITSMVKWSAVGFVLILAPAIASAVFCFFSKNKIMPIIAAAMFLFVAVSAVGVSAAVKAQVNSSSEYVSALGYMQELVQLAIPSFLICGYFVYTAITGFITKKQAAGANGAVAEETVAAENVVAESAEGDVNEEN